MSPGRSTEPTNYYSLPVYKLVGGWEPRRLPTVVMSWSLTIVGYHAMSTGDNV